MTSCLFKHTQSIYSCKRRTTLMLDALGDNADVGKIFSLTNSGNRALDEIYSPSSFRSFSVAFERYGLEKNKTPEQIVSRGLLLDFFAYDDGFPSWENFHHKHQGFNDKTYIFRAHKDNEDRFHGCARVYVIYDQLRAMKPLYNPAEKFRGLPIGYSWGYNGSSCTELSRALCFDLGEKYLPYIDFVREHILGFFPVFNEFETESVEYVFTEKELRVLIDARVSQPAKVSAIF